MLTINNVKDLAGNAENNSTLPFSFYSAQQYDVLIDEIMADPSPPVALPEYEYVELVNRSSFPLNLSGWTIHDLTAKSGNLPSVILQPDSFLIVCSSSALAALSNFGHAVSVTNFPSLDNNGDLLWLSDASGKTIDAVQYDNSWYRNDIKKNGGWSLEMIDIKNPCSGADNWKASIDSKGGTPGQKNSVDGNNPDEQTPVLLRTYTIDSTAIVSVFNKTIDSTLAAQKENYVLDNNIGHPLSASPLPPLFNEVRLTLPGKIFPDTLYHLTASNIFDCSGNMVRPDPVRVGLPVAADTNDVVINEILFNPKSNGYDYVEFYNRSKKIFDLKKLYVSTRDVTGALKSITAITDSSFLIFPGDYYVITENNLWVQQNYLVKSPQNLFQLSALPSFPDDEGFVVLLDQNEKIIDELHYNSNWQLAVIADPSGVALERIDYNKPTQDKNNWASAASTAGYGTPTYQNSEFMAMPQTNSGITITPKLFSPDNDGYEDYCFINYQVSNAGFVANINIYDASGRIVRNLANNATLALNGNFKWDGLDDKQQKLPVGIYIIITQIFDLTGKTKQFKNVVTLARKM
ncbi:MAG: lamin tail domain-containing protein [Bacteroidetes bacterium]|nr:lamin tail domain-containing protein [Bacteroidota bacterium]